MRQGFSRELESLVRCADPIAIEKIFAEVELRGQDALFIEERSREHFAHG